MNAKKAGIICAVAVLGLASVVFITTTVRAVLYVPADEIPLPESVLREARPAETVTARGENPVRLSIPAIDVDAYIQDVGLSRRGNMAVPTNYTDVGWYRYGASPGKEGSAVIAGHLDNGFGIPAVFARLRTLAEGEDVYVTTQEGKNLRFVATEVKSYPYAEVPTDTLFNEAGEPRLALITCGGSWLPEDETYNERVVVFATLAD